MGAPAIPQNTMKQQNAPPDSATLNHTVQLSNNNFLGVECHRFSNFPAQKLMEKVLCLRTIVSSGMVHKTFSKDAC